MEYKGFKIPHDTFLLLSTLCDLTVYSWRASKTPMPVLLKSIREKGGMLEKKPGPRDLAELDKRWRAATYFLRHWFKTDRPCLPRSLVLYKWCVLHGFESSVVIGVQKDNTLLKGHSWLLLEGLPYHEEDDHLNRYTVMLKG